MRRRVIADIVLAVGGQNEPLLAREGSHPLRAYDAVQLACALTLCDRLTALGVAPIFVSADGNLVNVAGAELLSSDNPLNYP